MFLHVSVEVRCFVHISQHLTGSQQEKQNYSLSWLYVASKYVCSAGLLLGSVMNLTMCVISQICSLMLDYYGRNPFPKILVHWRSNWSLVLQQALRTFPRDLVNVFLEIVFVLFTYPHPKICIKQLCEPFYVVMKPSPLLWRRNMSAKFVTKNWSGKYLNWSR
jgi:hypothetical protein